MREGQGAHYFEPPFRCRCTNQNSSGIGGASVGGSRGAGLKGSVVLKSGQKFVLVALWCVPAHPRVLFLIGFILGRPFFWPMQQQGRGIGWVLLTLGLEASGSVEL